MSRTLEEVQATIQIAKLKENDLHNTSHCLTFGESVSSGDYCLMELDDTLCKHIEAGKSLVIRGDQDERAVLCSEDKTYDLKIADTSNLLLLVPGCLTPDQLTTDNQASSQLVHAQIWGFSNSYWELRKRHPKLKKLKRLLMENPYEGPGISGQEDVTEGKYTMGDLLERIQASEEELEAQLQTIHACDVNGYWRLLDFDYEMKLLGHITQLVDSESWSFSKVPLRVSLEELGRLEPQEMIEHSFNCYGRRYTDNDEVFFALNEDKVCRATAQMLLQNAAKFNLAEFQEVWQQSVPDGMGTRLDQLKVRMGSDWQLRGMGTRLDQLKSLALVDRSSKPETISLLRVEDLPEDTLERFTHLFTMRQKWTEEDITPYIQDLCGEKQTTGALLTKYARLSTQNGMKVFNSRRLVAT
ncbi:sister chromatid cohesion protein DCC1-like isoform X5 [Oncorhynchus keta]|uniref:sister chromatid cohesion protein DCC1-like isoform X4 n=1 Tax=Oncorhynchus keta TaxID=8018 RepID=UPI00227C0224|nr:sister chromatid cohesion protein DCC1-like isoform X4 [Oncorhynchus keta]XP_052361239.1 sister chromatid cohesion protein DCC1-like isoform X5 [Oncorhynchus keta]